MRVIFEVSQDVDQDNSFLLYSPQRSKHITGKWLLFQFIHESLLIEGSFLGWRNTKYSKKVYVTSKIKRKLLLDFKFKTKRPTEFID